MLFEISNEVLTEENKLDLDTFVKRYLEDRIFVEFTDVEQAESWIGELVGVYRDKWNQLLVNSARIKARKNVRKIYLRRNQYKVVPNTASTHDENEITVSDACSMLDRNLVIGLENARNDLMFLRCLLSHKAREQFKALENNDKIKIIGGGLGELKKQIEVELARPRGSFFFRALSWVMFDSDAPYPGGTPQANKDIADLCERNALSYHCLERRAIENYISHDIYLLAHDRESDASRAIYSLSKEQLKHYNFKIGFKNNKDERKLSLYNTLSDDTKNQISKGFGSKIVEKIFLIENIETIHSAFKKNGTLDEFGDKLRHLEQLIGRPV